MNLVDLNLEEFSREVASFSPAPGGGSVAAYAGAQGFALIAMVCRLTLGREKFAAVQEEMRSLMEVAEAKQARLLVLVDEDTYGFKAVMEALSLVKNTEEEKSIRREALEKATLRAAEIPLQTATLCLEGLREIPKLIDSGNPNALSDIGVSSLMFSAGLEGALYNVQINAIGLKNRAERESLITCCNSLRAEGCRLAKDIQDQILSKMM